MTLTVPFINLSFKVILEQKKMNVDLEQTYRKELMEKELAASLEDSKKQFYLQ